MDYILDLSINPRTEGTWLSSYSKFRSISRSIGVDIHWITARRDPQIDGLYSYPDIENQISSASAFILRTPAFLRGDPEYIKMISDKVSAGIPLLCLLDRGWLNEQNDFLNRFGVEGTHIGLFSKEDNKTAAHCYDIRLDRDRFPGSFRDRELFNGVQSLRLDNTNAIRLHGSAQSLLAVPSNHSFVVDKSTDLPTDWPAPEVTCMAAFIGLRADRTQVFALHTSLLRDKFADIHGDIHLSIEGENNAQFAENLISVMSRRTASESSSKTIDANQELERLERNYFDFTKNVLDCAAHDWWSRIPERIRESCRVRKESEPYSRFPESAYLNLLDYQKIWKSHWESFLPMLREVGIEGGKSKALGYFTRLNDIRKLIAHPTKLHAAGIRIPTTDLQFLVREAQRSVSLWNLVCRPDVVR